MDQLTRQPQAIVFDLDDTLYPEIDYVRSGFRAAAGRIAGAACDANAIADKMWRLFHEGRRERIFNTVLAELGLSDDGQIIAELVSVYRCHRPNLKLATPVRKLLAELKKAYRLGLLSDGYLPAQRLKVEALQIAEFFDHIIYTEELGREYWKPSVRAFELMAAALDCPAADCVYVADNPAKDFLAPNQLGWQTIQIKSATGVHGAGNAPADGDAQYVLQDVTELAQILLTP